jgi:hypothetical protein
LRSLNAFARREIIGFGRGIGTGEGTNHAGIIACIR